MSGAEKQRQDEMVARMIALEEQKLHAGSAQGMSEQSVANVVSRLMREKEVILTQHERTPALSVKRGGMLRYVIPLGTAAALLIAVGVILLLPRRHAAVATLAFTSGSVKTVQGGAAAGQTLFVQGDQLETGEKSFAQLKFGDTARLAMAPQSAIRFSHLALDKTPAMEIHSGRGSVFADLDKACCDFVINTETATIKVTGTSFQVTVDESGTTVQVLDGSVLAEARKDYLDKTGDTKIRNRLQQPVAVAAKQKLRLNTKTHTFEISALTQAEVDLLERYRRFARAEGGAAEQQKIAQSLMETQLKGSGENGGQRLTLADIKAKYGKLSRVNLLNGKSYTGFFIMRGGQVEIITASGSVRVSATELKDVQDLP